MQTTNMKRTLFILMIILTIPYCFAQNKRAFIGIEFGIASPIGEFSATEANYLNSGYATTGLALDICLKYKLSNWVGLNASLIRAVNGVDIHKLNPNFPPMPASNVNYPSYINSVLLGAYLKKSSFPLYAKLSLGYGSVHIAEMSLYDNYGNKFSITQSNPSYGLAYEVGFGAFIPVSKSIALTASIDLLGCIAKPSYTTDASYSYPTTEVKYNQNIINSHIGIGYMFN